MTEPKGVRAKLAARKAANAGARSETLKKSGIEVSIPNFINHGLWMKAQRIAKGDTAKAQTAFIAETVLFEGEKLTITDIAELVDAADTMQLIGEIFGDDEDEAGDDAGNGVTPKSH